MVTLTLGHILMVLAAIAAVIAIVNTSVALRHGRGRHRRGTPQYARARMARRTAFYALGVALLLAVLCLTPLCSIDLVSLGA
jgi:hypothetical protein